MSNGRALPWIALTSVVFALTATLVTTLTNPEKKNMVAYKEKGVRVVCYLPDEQNRKLQAYATLDGKSKQDLMAEILIAWVNNTEDKKPSTKTPAKKQPVKQTAE